MNLLLYTESKIALARLTDETLAGNDFQTLALNPGHALPSSLFEELGYYGALDEDGQIAEETFAGLLGWFAGSALSF